VRLACAVLCAWLSACTEARHTLVDDPLRALDAASAPDARAPEVAASESHAVPPDAAPAPVARCGKHACACDNGLDDDQDGLVDGLDPECTAAFDDDEATFATGLSNKQGGCRDCFWDDNAGNGDDGCRYPSECLTGAAPNGNGNCSSCQVSQACVDNCRVRTPNGCDCFGCCEVVRGGGEHVFIEVAESCRLDRLDDLDSCPRCVPSTACQNPCGRCELCLGKTVDSLPADCRRGAGQPSYQCDDGLRTCVSSADCQHSEYCQLGCCLVDLL
jgi:hypothetical protein